MAVTRRHAREWALQLLFQLEAVPNDELAEVFAAFWLMQWRMQREEQEEEEAAEAGEALPMPEDQKALAAQVAPGSIRSFVKHLVTGVQQNREAIDERIATYADNWTLQRMGGVDRAVLRLAMFEMFFDDQAPPVVIINEAVDLAKFFSSSESGKFVNGIMDRAGKDAKRPPREARGNPKRWRRKKARDESATAE